MVDWWEYRARPAMRELCQAYSRKAARARRGRKEWLYLRLQDALEEADWKEVAMVREELRQMLMYEEKGLIIRSRYQQEAEEERASLYHVAKEIGSTGKGGLTKLKVKRAGLNGAITEEVIDDDKQIEDILTQFHDALFNARLDANLEDTGETKIPRVDLHHQEFLSKLDKLSDQSKQMLEVNLTEEEVKENLKMMENGKSPGEDGLPKEFYHSLWDVLGPDMVKVIQATLDRELLPESDTRGLTRPISKVNPPAVPLVTELRPITKLNVAYKLLSRCLATRAKNILPEVIRSRQLAIPGKEITEGVHNIISTIAHIEKRNVETGNYGGFLASYDNVKAFDVTNTGYCDIVMDYMNFGAKFRRWFLMMNRGATTRLLLPNGRLSREIRVSSSVRQGDNFSLIAYELQFEPYLRRLDEVVVGVTMGSPRPGPSQNPAAYTEKGPACVDDSVVVSTDINDLMTVDQVAARYEEQSGAMLSRTNKSRIMFLGSWKNENRRPTLPVKYFKVEKQLKIFGIIITPIYKVTLQKTWEERITKLRGQCIKWSSRNLPTLQQRVQVLNMYITSRITYHALVLPLSPKYAKQFEIEVRRFLFRGKITMGKLKLEELSNPTEKGGLGLIDIRRKSAALFLKHTMRMLTREEGGWRHMSYWLHHHLPQFTLHDGPRALELPTGLHKHIKEVLMDAVEEKSVQELKGMRTKEMYKMLCEDLPLSRLQVRNPGVDVPGLVYPRLANPVLGVGARFVMFSLVNDIFRNREYMFRVWNIGDPTCDHEPDPHPGQCAGELQTLGHMFQRCAKVSDAWEWLRAYMFQQVIQPGSVTEEQFLSLQFDVPRNRENEVTWILGSYMEYIAREAVERGRCVGVSELRGFLRQKLLTYSQKNTRPLNILSI